MNKLGKRYECEECESELVCVKGGDGGLECCGEPMRVKQMKPLPSSD